MYDPSHYSKLRIGEVFRYSRPYSPIEKEIDGFPNYFSLVNTTGCNLPLLESGVNPIAEVKTLQSKRRPAVLIRSSPHKIGSLETPWQDFFNPDFGNIRYYGDNKTPGVPPEIAPGNKVLRELFFEHTSREQHIRQGATPIIFFRGVPVNGKIKGFVQFQGFGIIRSIQLITQYDRKLDRTFANYEFDFAVFSISQEDEEFDWNWISDRRTIADPIECNKNAPESWKTWTRDGERSINKVLRRVSKIQIISTLEQRPKPGTMEEKALKQIYEFYGLPGRNKRFEALASRITASTVSRTSRNYREGWLTGGSSDGGADFIGRLDVGEGPSRVKLILLGQAKCERPDLPTGGNHIARTVARLRRGWIGAYVTTSYFSDPVQLEVIEDEYPLLLINGMQVASESLRIVADEGFASLDEFLKFIDSRFETMIRRRLPEEILLD